MPSLLSLVALLVLAAFAAPGGSWTKNQDTRLDSFTREHDSKHVENPEGVSFTIRFKDDRKQFHQGEIITLELSFAASKPDTFILDAASYDRRGRLEIDGFVLDRPDDVVDPVADYFDSALFGYAGGGMSATPELTDKPELISTELNEWMRFDRPGHYRLYVVSGRISRKGSRTGNRDLQVVSNVVEFDILPADKKWTTQKLNDAITTLSKPKVDHSAACRTLRFLPTTAAVSEMRKRFRDEDRDCDSEYEFGLIGSPHRDFVIRDMETGLSSPEQPITTSFFTTLALLEFMRQAEPLPPYPDGTDEQNKQWQAQLARHRSAYDKLQLNYLGQLAAAIPQKQGRARATSLQTLLDVQAELNTSDFSGLLASMPDVFRLLPLDEQARFLEHQWKPIASASMLPVLRGILKHTESKPNDYQEKELRSLALKRLYELAPDEGRRLIFDEIRRPAPRVNKNALRLLPEETLPEFDLVLATNLEEAPRGGGDSEAISELIERYATAQILPRVRAVFDAAGVGRWACSSQAALLAYFLRVDPSVGGEYLNKVLAARGLNQSGCYSSTFRDVPPLHMSKEVEDAATASLDDEDAEVASQAALVLGQYGGADAEKALWQRLEKWHEANESRSEEIREQYPGVPSRGAPALSGEVLIEQALRNALANGRAWVMDPEKLKRLRELCLTEQGRSEVDEMLRLRTTATGAERP